MNCRLPVWQLDGGRGFRALSRSERFWVTGLLAALGYWTGEGLLVLLLLVTGLRAFGGEADDKRDRVAFAQFLVLLAALSALTLIQVQF
jgi:Zn-dependent protease